MDDGVTDPRTFLCDVKKLGPHRSLSQPGSQRHHSPAKEPQLGQFHSVIKNSLPVCQNDQKKKIQPLRSTRTNTWNCSFHANTDRTDPVITSPLHRNRTLARNALWEQKHTPNLMEKNMFFLLCSKDMLVNSICSSLAASYTPATSSAKIGWVDFVQPSNKHTLNGGGSNPSRDDVGIEFCLVRPEGVCEGAHMLLLHYHICAREYKK